jgi:hypothetical protein
MIPIDPITAIAAGAVALTATGFCLGSAWRKSRTPKESAPSAPAAPALQDQAIGEVELIEALVALRLPPETARLFKDRVSTMQQLQDMVAMIRGGAKRSVEEKMFACAMSYAREHSLGDTTLAAKALVIAQCNAPEGTVHPAFATIRTDILVAGRTVNEALRGQLSQMECGIQSGSWVQERLREEARELPRYERYGYGYGSRSHCDTYTRDVLQPSDRGTLQLERITTYDDLGDLTSRMVACEFNPPRTEAETHFWSTFARARIEAMVKREYDKDSFSVRGDLLIWTRFLSALGNAPSSETPALSALSGFELSR